MFEAVISETQKGNTYQQISICSVEEKKIINFHFLVIDDEIHSFHTGVI